MCIYLSHKNFPTIFFQVQVLRCDHSVLNIKKHMCTYMGKGRRVHTGHMAVVPSQQ